MLGSITCTVDASLAGPEKSQALSPLVPIYCNTKHKLSKSYWLDHQTKHALCQHYLSLFWQEDFSNHNHASCVILLISYKITINSPHAMLAYFLGLQHASLDMPVPVYFILCGVSHKSQRGSFRVRHVVDFLYGSNLSYLIVTVNIPIKMNALRNNHRLVRYDLVTLIYNHSELWIVVLK